MSVFHQQHRQRAPCDCRSSLSSASVINSSVGEGLQSSSICTHSFETISLRFIGLSEVHMTQAGPTGGVLTRTGISSAFVLSPFIQVQFNKSNDTLTRKILSMPKMPHFAAPRRKLSFFQLFCMALVVQNLFKEFSASAGLNEMTGVKI